MDPLKRLTLPEILAHEWLKETNEDSEEESEAEGKFSTDFVEEAKSEDKDKDQDKDKKSSVERSKTEKDDKDEDIDLKAISGNINFVNVDNLFYLENYKTKLSYTDYCCITEDFTTHNLEEEALKTVESFGYPRTFVLKCLNTGIINHATASYFLLTLQNQDPS